MKFLYLLLRLMFTLESITFYLQIKAGTSTSTTKVTTAVETISIVIATSAVEQLCLISPRILFLFINGR